ncbi:nitroreductase family deazaflavin-dependent oxidoreductase [Pseudonocardia pini]|uniref:nitroreductase family deazaflavin-dependent oxidoreductase n=1 Tax=Pseudonocardia pini TaxID=2758030 RepID=UPI0015F097B1|nr:nitroreductase family deazaflavin-dependent oxidoreductase [Pseudonocardia pini]
MTSETDPETGYVRPDLELLGDEHVARYRATAGEIGHSWNGVHCLLLAVPGRRTGIVRRTPLIYGCDGATSLVVASNGGSQGHPSWYLNVVAAGSAEIQVGPQTMTVDCRPITEPDRYDLAWARMCALWPNYAVYRRRTSRTIPIVALLPRW